MTDSQATTRQLTKAEIIEETIQAYAPDPLNLRAVEDGKCLYLKGGCKCGFSRCMKEEALEIEVLGHDRDVDEDYNVVRVKIKDFHGSVDALVDALIYTKDVSILTKKEALRFLLRPEYPAFTVGFWDHIQGIHDIEENWSKGGLSNFGKMCVYNICNKHNIYFKDVPSMAGFTPEKIYSRKKIVNCE